jgi:hypothetical protein
MNARYALGIAAIAMAVFATTVLVCDSTASPIPGTYTSALRPGTHPGVQLGRVSVSRQYPNSGNPKTFNGQSWNSSVLGAQWEIRCGVETTSVPPVFGVGFNYGTMTGYVTYNQTFAGGTFALYADPAVGWGSGSGTITTTSIATQVYLMNSVPVSSSFTGVMTGTFDAGCTLDFAMGNGFGAGETSDPPYLTEPANYPPFLASNCVLADASHQFGVWGDVNDIIVSINTDCATPTRSSTWGALKSIYR